MEIKEVQFVKAKVYRVSVALEPGSAAVRAYADFDVYSDGTDEPAIVSESVFSREQCTEIWNAVETSIGQREASSPGETLEPGS